MRLTVLGSGSTGNAVLICAGQTRVLVDAGLSAKETVRRLALVGEDVTRLDGVVITHEHSDHAGGLRELQRCFLRHIVADSFKDPMRVLAHEFLGVRRAVCGGTVEVTGNRDRRSRNGGP